MWNSRPRLFFSRAGEGAGSTCSDVGDEGHEIFEHYFLTNLVWVRN
jgi:hypothetical protein